MPATSWVDVPHGSAFPVQNLPYGVFSHGDHRRHVGVAIGERVLDVTRLTRAQRGDLATALSGPTLNAFLALGRPAWADLRAWLTQRLTDERHRPDIEPFLLPLQDVDLHLPFDVADYVDFYSSEHHATNVGRIFRPDGDALTPNWKHLPIGYHGRSATVVVSQTPISRPNGQRKAPTDAAPTFGPSRRLDIEAEVGFVVGVGSQLGTPIDIADFADHVFGVCLVNDWSARDIQAWEYVPLGPFLGKSFATTVSPWIVPLAALEAARCEPPPRDPQPQPYLRDVEPWGLDLQLEVELNGTVISRPPFRTMYWTPAQQLAHLTVNGANVRPGDLYASGTVSGPEPDQRGSLLELAWSGAEPITLDDGSTRSFLSDGDTVVMRAWAPGVEGVRIGFGEATGTVGPAHPAAT